MEVWEYELLVEAKQWQKYDREREIHWEAYLHRVVDATDKKGNYVFPKFEDFFNEDRVKANLGLKTDYAQVQRNRKLADIAKNLNK